LGDNFLKLKFEFEDFANTLLSGECLKILIPVLGETTELKGILILLRVTPTLAGETRRPV
jgi:hypothetical protein